MASATEVSEEDQLQQAINLSKDTAGVASEAAQIEAAIAKSLEEDALKPTAAAVRSFLGVGACMVALP